MFLIVDAPETMKEPRSEETPVPLAWREFMRFCKDLRYGEIERLSIQNGLPVLAELIKKKVKFTGES